MDVAVTPQVDRIKLETLGRVLENSQSVPECKQALISLSEGASHENPGVVSTALIELGKALNSPSFTLDDETLGEVGKNIIEAVRNGLPSSQTVDPLNYVNSVIRPLAPLCDATWQIEMGQALLAHGKSAPVETAISETEPTPQSTPYVRKLSFKSPSGTESVAEEVEDSMVIAIETLPGFRSQHKVELEGINKILGHELEQIVDVTKHGKITSQFYDNVHFIQLPVLSFNPDPDGHYLLTKKDLTVLISERGLVVIEPEGSRFTSRAHEEYTTRGMGKATPDSHYAFAIHLFQSVIDENKEILGKLEIQSRRLLSESNDLQGKRETENVLRQKRRLAQALDYLGLQSEESSIDFNVLSSCIHANHGSNGLQARLQTLGSSMHSLAKSAENDKKLMDEISANIDRSDKARTDASLIKLTVPVTVSAVWVTIDVPLKLVHEHKPEWILIGVAGTAISIAWGLIMMNRKRR
jgi:hypothetical protein